MHQQSLHEPGYIVAIDSNDKIKPYFIDCDACHQVGINKISEVFPYGKQIT